MRRVNQMIDDDLAQRKERLGVKWLDVLNKGVEALEKLCAPAKTKQKSKQ